MQISKRDITIFLSTTLILILIIIGCTKNKNNKNIIVVDDLWGETIHQILQDDLWIERDAYDAGHYLMIPMHYAFLSKDIKKMNEFEIFFKRFLSKNSQGKISSLDTLTKLHFLYLTSQYLVIANITPLNELTALTVNHLENIWQQPAWQWKQCNSPNFNNMKERINWKLKNKNVAISYCRAIIDEELFTLAIAADIKTILKKESPKFIDDALSKSYDIFKEEVTFENDSSMKWLFQPGVWTDGPSHIYSGHNVKLPGLIEKKDPKQAWDTSHSHRFPLWLLSLERAFLIQNKMNESNFFSKLREGLSKQFMEKVLVFPSKSFSNYRTTNYMDGKNGLYRYSMERNNYGYGPYELSGTMLIGWWAFLPDSRIKNVYNYISSQFPLSQKEVDIYLDLNTVRDRNKLIEGISPYKNGFLELISKLASKI